MYHLQGAVAQIKNVSLGKQEGFNRGDCIVFRVESGGSFREHTIRQVNLQFFVGIDFPQPQQGVFFVEKMDAGKALVVSDVVKMKVAVDNRNLMVS